MLLVVHHITKMVIASYQPCPQPPTSSKSTGHLTDAEVRAYRPEPTIAAECHKHQNAIEHRPKARAPKHSSLATLQEIHASRDSTLSREHLLGEQKHPAPRRSAPLRTNAPPAPLSQCSQHPATPSYQWPHDRQVHHLNRVLRPPEVAHSAHTPRADPLSPAIFA